MDILGFEKLPSLISHKTQVSNRKIRKDFLKVIQDKIEISKTKGYFIGAINGQGDDWLLAVNSVNSVLKLIFELFDHNTEYLGFEKIPLEIAVGCCSFDAFSSLTGNGLICENSTIDFLKKPIIKFYRDWYKLNKKDRLFLPMC